MRWKFEACEPIGKSKGWAFIDGRTVDVEMPVFDDSVGAGIRSTRLGCGLTLRRAAVVLNMTAVELSELERGRTILADEQLKRVIELLRYRT